jgi:hypothetical protein
MEQRKLRRTRFVCVKRCLALSRNISAVKGSVCSVIVIDFDGSMALDRVIDVKSSTDLANENQWFGDGSVLS